MGKGQRGGRAEALSAEVREGRGGSRGGGFRLRIQFMACTELVSGTRSTRGPRCADGLEGIKRANIRDWVNEQSSPGQSPMIVLSSERVQA